MEPITWVLGSIAVGAISLSVGKAWTSKDCVKEGSCLERRNFCTELHEQHFKTIEAQLERLEKIILNGGKGE